MLIRSWNLFHGNTFPPRRQAYLGEMVRLVTADRPDAVLLQELPVWALPRLEAWSGMTAVADAARRPRFGPLPIPAGLGKLITEINHGLLRSAFTGQANAILLGTGLRPTEHRVVALNDRRLRHRRLKERRVCQAIRVLREEAPPFVLANLHATGSVDLRIPLAQVRRAAAFATELAHEGDAIVVGGDFNIQGAEAALDGFSAPGPGIDHIVVRGAEPSPIRVWPDERRRRSGMLLSDHPVVELDLP